MVKVLTTDTESSGLKTGLLAGFFQKLSVHPEGNEQLALFRAGDAGQRW